MKLVKPVNFKDELTIKQIKSWRENGYLLINNVIEPELLCNIKTLLDEIYPQIDDITKIEELSRSQDFGSKGVLEFPCKYNAINQLTLSPNIIKCAKTLLDHNDIRLIQSDVWAKYGGSNYSNVYSNRDQRMHVDFPNHNMVHPSDWNNPETVTCIIYYDNYSDVGGSTAFVPRVGDTPTLYKYPLLNTPGVSGYPMINNKETTEKYFKDCHPEIYEFRKKLYEGEMIGNYIVGTVLFYRLDLWHRGTPVNLHKVRRVQNLEFKKSGYDWITSWNKGFSRSFYNEYLEKLIANLTVEQRNCLGFPHPGHEYWNKNTLEYVKKRYEPYGFDITPYL